MLSREPIRVAHEVQGLVQRGRPIGVSCACSLLKLFLFSRAQGFGANGSEWGKREGRWGSRRAPRRRVTPLGREVSFHCHSPGPAWPGRRGPGWQAPRAGEQEPGAPV